MSTGQDFSHIFPVQGNVWSGPIRGEIWLNLMTDVQLDTAE